MIVSLILSYSNIVSINNFNYNLVPILIYSLTNN